MLEALWCIWEAINPAGEDARRDEAWMGKFDSERAATSYEFEIEKILNSVINNCISIFVLFLKPM
jgi:hypothetical protein